LKVILQLMQLPLACAAIWLVSASNMKARLDAAVVGRPAQEVVLYFGLACIPWLLARTKLLSGGITASLSKLAGLLRMRISWYGGCIGVAHTLLAAVDPVATLCQSTLYFSAVNLAFNAVPQSFAMTVPRIFRFLDADGNGLIEATEIEDFVYELSSQVLLCVFAWASAQFCLAVKKPPRDWEGPEGLRGRKSWIQQYWFLTTSRFGWWTVLDWTLTAAIIVLASVPWLRLLQVDWTTLLAVGSFIGFALGLAAQKIVSNVVAGLIILISKPFQVGDRIENGHADVRFHAGVVRRISWDVTVLELDDGAEVLLPNSQLVDYPTLILARTQLAKPVLDVRVVAAHGLRNADGFGGGVSDPYAVASVGSVSFRTETVKDSLDPEWKAPPFSFELNPSGRDTELIVQVFDEDFIGRDDFLGQSKLDLRKLKPGCWLKHRELMDDGAGAELEYMVRFTCPEET